MKYRKLSRYKYETVGDTEFQCLVRPEHDIITSYGLLRKDGSGVVFDHYAWDGASGPTWDDKTNMTPSLVHDFLYQLMREGYLPQSAREPTDQTLHNMCVARGMWKERAKCWLKGVRLFAWFASKRTTKPQDKIYEVD